jgi:hypothetical protein
MAGIFKFPLDRVSPSRRRGVSQDVEIPYITPSLRDYPVGTPGDAAGALRGLWTIKWVDCMLGLIGAGYCDLFSENSLRFIAAPWRSLIYRNVDAPYIYTDDFTVFPHMPRHSMGFDCRAPRILGDWMVSVPALHKPEGASYEDQVRAPPFDTNAQPYEEITGDPSDPKYSSPKYFAALAAAADRLYEYHHGSRYEYCPDRSDIVVPEALTNPRSGEADAPDVPQYADSTRKKVIIADSTACPTVRTPSSPTPPMSWRVAPAAARLQG